jgi:pimeloyl-ACP methyl ester carboxylesterase
MIFLRNASLLFPAASTFGERNPPMMRRVLLPLVCGLVFLIPAALHAEDQFFDSNGVKIRYFVMGKGEPVVLIHGFTADIEKNWGLPGVLRELAKDYQVIALDNRGHGKSGKPHEPSKYGIEMVEDVVRLLDHLQIKQAHVIGYSMGAIITAKLLTVHPDRLLSATLGGHGGIRDGAPTQFYEELASSLEQGKGFRPLILRLTPTGQPKPSEEAIQVINSMIAKNNDEKALAAVARAFAELAVATDKLQSNQVPTLAVIGELDPLKTGVDQLRGHMSNLKIVVIKGSDHMTTMARPEFVKSLKDFLAEQNARKLKKAG